MALDEGFTNAIHQLYDIHEYRMRRYAAILDAYIRSGATGSYEEERIKTFRERGLGKLED